MTDTADLSVYDYYTRDLADAIGVRPETGRYQFPRHISDATPTNVWSAVLCALGRCDITPELDARIHTVAYSLHRAMTSGIVSPEAYIRVCGYSPWKVCEMVARVANLCPETTPGAIREVWLPRNGAAL